MKEIYFVLHFQIEKERERKEDIGLQPFGHESFSGSFRTIYSLNLMETQMVTVLVEDRIRLNSIGTLDKIVFSFLVSTFAL